VHAHEGRRNLFMLPCQESHTNISALLILSNPNYLSKALFQIPHIRIATNEFWKNTNIQSTTPLMDDDFNLR
jgi:hypothetical protein